MDQEMESGDGRRATPKLHSTHPATAHVKKNAASAAAAEALTRCAGASTPPTRILAMSSERATPPTCP